MKNSLITSSELMKYDKIKRATLVNQLSGFKSPVLIGTCGQDGTPNLAIFNSLIHIGSSPPLIGMTSRPLTVERHTYTNIHKYNKYTINFPVSDLIDQAHQCSAKYPEYISEFEAVGLVEDKKNGWKVPFVKGCPIQMGMSYVEEHKVHTNGVIILIGRVDDIYIDSSYIDPEGHLDLGKLNLPAVNGLHSYYKAERSFVKPYSRPY